MKKTILLGCVCALLWGCDAQLDLTPEDTLVDREVFGTEGGSEQALADAYMRLFRAATGNIAHTIGDFTTGNLHHSVFYNTYDDGSVTPADDGVQAVWENYYRAINVANNVIAKIPQFAQYGQDIQLRLIAEARFIRAYAYLDLLKLYGDGALQDRMDGLGVPLQLTPFSGYDTGDVMPRASNGAVFEQIIADLTEPAAQLPTQHGTDIRTRSRATQGAAAALLARTYLFMHRYADAADAAAAALRFRPSIYQLSTNLLAVFPQNSDGQPKALVPEHVLAFPVSHMASTSSTISNNLGNPYFFKRSLWIDESFIETFDAEDLRVKLLVFKGDSVHNPDQFRARTTFKFNNSNGRDNVPAIRIAEVLLARAEALARTTGVTQEAVELLNEVRMRANPQAERHAAGDFGNAGALVDAVLQERRKELAFEGFHRYDRIRTGNPPRSNGLHNDKWVLPIPQREIDISDGVIVQNAGYRQ